MRQATKKLLDGSGVSEQSHPVLVGLLETAAKGPGLPGGSGSHAGVRKRLQRDWGRVCEAFRACLAVGVSDASALKASMAVGKLPAGMSADPLDYRARVAAILETAALSGRAESLRGFDIETVADLRKAQKANGIPSFSRPLLDCPGKVETPLLPGRRVVVSWRLFGRRLFALLQADTYGRMTALGLSDNRASVLNLNPPSSHA